jgi:hypothetical protein
MADSITDFDNYRINYFLCILKIALKNEKSISQPYKEPLNGLKNTLTSF